MAKLTPGIGFGQASGSVGGVTYTPGRNGLVMRNRVLTTRPRTTSNTARKGQFADLARQWGALTDEQREAWTLYAAQLPPADPRFGAGPPTAFNAFIGYNMKLRYASQAFRTEPPPLGRVGIPTLTSWTIDIATSTLSVARGAGSTTTVARVLSMSQPLRPGRSNYKGVTTRRLTANNTGAAANQWSNYGLAWFTLSSAYSGMEVVVTSYFVSNTYIVSETIQQVITLA